MPSGRKWSQHLILISSESKLGSHVYEGYGMPERISLAAGTGQPCVPGGQFSGVPSEFAAATGPRRTRRPSSSRPEGGTPSPFCPPVAARCDSSIGPGGTLRVNDRVGVIYSARIKSQREASSQH